MAAEARRILVTGASAGIGLALIKRLARDKHQVFGCARNVTALQGLDCEGKDNIHPITCDVTKEDQIKSMFEEIDRQAGGLDICVNNAGMAKDDSLLNGSPDAWREMYEVNVIGLCMVTQHAVKLMVKGGCNDCIVLHIGSVLGIQQPIQYMPHRSAYIGTKCAVNGLASALRGELALAELADKIRVMTVSPGLVESNFMIRSSGAEKAQNVYEANDPLQPADVAETVVNALSTPQRAAILDFVLAPVFRLPKKN